MDYCEQDIYATFSERMDAAKEAAAQAARNVCKLAGRVTWKRKRMRETLDVEQAAAVLGCTVQRVRKLLSQGRIIGAYRARAGRRSWVIPTQLQPDGAYLPTVTEGKRGPQLRKADVFGLERAPF